MSQIQQYTPQQIVGVYTTAADASAKLAEVLDKVHLVSPATSIGALPEGCEVNFSLVHVNASDASSETYSTGGGKVGIAKVVLDKIAAASGVDWDAAASGRLDDGRDPRYCHFRAIGYVRTFDGRERQISAEKVMDLREGSPTVVGLREQVAKRNAERKPGTPEKSAELQIREMRMHILSHAESKARLRAIRGGLGIQTGYTVAELKKPFLVISCTFSGRTTDKALAREGYLLRMQAATAGRRALFGAPAVPSLPVQPAPTSFQPLDDDDREIVEVPPPPAPSPRPQAAPAPAAAPAPSAAPRTPPSTASAAREPSGLTMPFGRNKGTPIEELDDKDLSYWAGKMEEELADPDKARYHARVRGQLETVRAELAYRANPPQQSPADQGPPPGWEPGDAYEGRL